MLGQGFRVLAIFGQARFGGFSFIPFNPRSSKTLDSDYPTKQGVYYVTGTEISFSKEGGKRTVSLGRKLYDVKA